MMLKPEIFQVTLLILLLVFHKSSGESSCKINVKKDLHEQHPPIIVDSDLLGLKYHYPEADSGAEIVLNTGESVNIFCPGRTNPTSTKLIEPGLIEVNGKTYQESNTAVKVECNGHDKFNLDGKNSVRFSNISCQEVPRASYNPVLRAVGESCGPGFRYEIGFLMEDESFLRTIDLCHDPKTANTLWSHDEISCVNDPSVRYTGKNLKSFKTGILYEDMALSMENPYALNTTYYNFIETFHSVDVADKYVSPKMSDRKFLAIGHLIANADKVYKSEQMSTYFYANAVPMWQQVNAQPGNWFFIEDYIRFLAVHKKRDLEAWAGGLGVLELEGKPIYLYNKFNEKTGKVDQKIPVPRNLYKCVVDKIKKEALCFVAVNNPYATQKEISKPSNKYTVCKRYQACDRLTDSFTDLTRGYAYCCTLADFYSKNKKTIGLEDFKPYLNYKALELLTFDKKNPTVIDERKVIKKRASKKGRKISE